MAVRVTDGGNIGTRLSIFSFGGAMGFALGPMIAVAIVGWRVSGMFRPTPEEIDIDLTGAEVDEDEPVLA